MLSQEDERVGIEKVNIPFSVAMCVYEKDNAEWFDASLNSVIDQTVKPNEIVLVVDGPISNAIQKVIDKYSTLCKRNEIEFKPIYLEKNEGHGNARRRSLENCSYELVAIMDADDICVSNRFEQQLRIFETEQVEIVGGDIAEFIENCSDIVSYRNVPTCDLEIKEYMRIRCPFNQMTVMFKKKAVQNAGGYIDWYCNEDYYLWLRMYLGECRFMNTGTVLVYVRVGKEMYQRRGGLRYFKSEAKLQKYMYDNKIIGLRRTIINLLKRCVIQVLLPNRIRGWIFQRFARNQSGNIIA